MSKTNLRLNRLFGHQAIIWIVIVILLLLVTQNINMNKRLKILCKSITLKREINHIEVVHAHDSNDARPPLQSARDAMTLYDEVLARKLNLIMRDDRGTVDENKLEVQAFTKELLNPPSQLPLKLTSEITNGIVAKEVEKLLQGKVMLSDFTS